MAFCDLDLIKYSNYIKFNKVFSVIECVKYFVD